MLLIDQSLSGIWILALLSQTRCAEIQRVLINVALSQFSSPVFNGLTSIFSLFPSEDGVCSFLCARGTLLQTFDWSCFFHWSYIDLFFWTWAQWTTPVVSPGIPVSLIIVSGHGSSLFYHLCIPVLHSHYEIHEYYNLPNSSVILLLLFY